MADAKVTSSTSFSLPQDITSTVKKLFSDRQSEPSVLLQDFKDGYQTYQKDNGKGDTAGFATQLNEALHSDGFADSIHASPEDVQALQNFLVAQGCPPNASGNKPVD